MTAGNTVWNNIAMGGFFRLMPTGDQSFKEKSLQLKKRKKYINSNSRFDEGKVDHESECGK